jgi:cytochrome P450
VDEPLPDFLDPSLLESGVPHAAYRRLRDQDPVSWLSGPDGGYWLLTRHADVRDASLDAAAFSSWRGTTGMDDPPGDRLEVSRLILINMDPPQHTRYRRLITRGFASRAVEQLEPHVRAMCRGLIEAAAPRGGGDFVAEVAAPLPMRVILELLGVPDGDRAHLQQLSNEMIDQAGKDAGLAAAMRMYGYAFELATARRKAPGDDLVSVLLQAEIDGERLTDGEFNAFFLLLVVAGNETTRNLISGGMLALLEHPEELAALRRDRALLPGAVEEMLRWTSPVAQFRRTAHHDVALHGRTIREGDKVILAHASANRDERAFVEPDRFDVRRTPNPHIAFGFGPHLCLGASLARLEARVMFEELLPRLDRIELAGAPRRVRSNFVSGYQSLPLAWRG